MATKDLAGQFTEPRKLCPISPIPRLLLVSLVISEIISAGAAGGTSLCRPCQPIV